MKKIGIVLLTMLFFACSDNDDTVILKDYPELSGTWVLVEQNLDPGDGSGEFVKVDSEKTIEFLEDGIFRSKGELCAINADSGPEKFGKYTINDALTNYSPENNLIQNGCDVENNHIGFYLDGSSLILTFPCIEGCAQKFRKM